MNWRWYLFWFKDYLTGKKVKKVYDELNNDYKKINKTLQKNKLSKLLNIAINNTEFYKNCSNDIKSFPVVNKQIIKDNFNKVFNKNYDLNSLHKMSTSGSTGTPFVVYQNKEKRNAVLAEILFFGKQANYRFGEKQIFARIWLNANNLNKIKRILQNMIPFDISSLNKDNLKGLDETIINKKVNCIMGYASSLDKYSDYLMKKETKGLYHVKSVISGSELLNENTRRKLSEYFNCKVFSRYANQENGLLGQDNGYDKDFWLNETNYYFEFLKLNDDIPAKEGELARIVVTDLLNYSQPLIRYDTGDLCKFKIKGGKKYIQELYGRKRDIIYDTLGNPIEAATISVNFWKFAHIVQFQFIQETKNKYKLLLNIENGFNEEKEILTLFKSLLGKEAIIVIEYVNEIPVLNSGKRKTVVNKFKTSTSKNNN